MSWNKSVHSDTGNRQQKELENAIRCDRYWSQFYNWCFSIAKLRPSFRSLPQIWCSYYNDKVLLVPGWVQSSIHGSFRPRRQRGSLFFSTIIIQQLAPSLQASPPFLQTFLHYLFFARYWIFITCVAGTPIIITPLVDTPTTATPIIAAPGREEMEAEMDTSAEVLGPSFCSPLVFVGHFLANRLPRQSQRLPALQNWNSP